MLRFIVSLLVVANLAFLAYTQGWLKAAGLAPERPSEPERLGAQVQPETIRLVNGAPPLPPEAAPPAPTAAPQAPAAGIAPSAATDTASCWQAKGFTAARAQALKAALTGAGLAGDSWQFDEVRRKGRWLIYMGRYDEQQMQKKQGELRKLGVEFREINLPSVGPGLALGAHDTEESVNLSMANLRSKGVRTARIIAEPGEVVTLDLRLTGVSAEQRAKIAELREMSGHDLQSCGTVPPPAPAAAAPPPAPAVAPAASAAPTGPAPATDTPPVAQMATACWQATGFALTQASSIQSSLEGAGLSAPLWELKETRVPGRWVVYMGRFDDEQMVKKKEELRALSVSFREVNLPSAGPGLALGTFFSEDDAEKGLNDLKRKGVRSARVAAERAEGVSLTLRLPALTNDQRARVGKLGGIMKGRELRACN
jgi:hypothetical protein